VAGLRLPAGQFYLLLGVLAGTMFAPLLFGPEQMHLGSRAVGLICLLLLASGRPSILSWRLVEPMRAELAGVAIAAPAAAPPTLIHPTEHRGLREDDDFSLNEGLANDFVNPALERLRSCGRFDREQLHLIETELRMIEGHNIAINYASSLDKGVLVGRFVIDQPLGRGGEGNVYKAHDSNGEPAAIKILNNMRVSDRFRREMHLVRQLAHPNIVTAYEVGEFRGLPFITMELLQGPDLNVLVQDAGPLNWLDATQYVLQTARALDHAHRRDLIHRDIKPGNLILDGGDVKVVDFGLAAMCGIDTSMDSVFRFETKDGHLAGTLPYMAPEQARSLANATVQSDIYALGATWFYLLTGKERLRGNTFSKQFENLLVQRRFSMLPSHYLPASLHAVYERMVAYEVEDRFQSCAELIGEIERSLQTEGESVDVEGIDVLVVEDSRTDMLFTIELLRRSNSTLTIHQARSLADGLEACRQSPIDLVLLDLTLPDSCGVDTVRRFRCAYADLPLVVLTGLSQDEIGFDCLAAGADTFISKNGLTAHRMERMIFVTLSRCRFPRKSTV
jgi:serine/threonine protein kinase